MNRLKDKFYNSIVFRIGVLVFLISFISLASMLSTVFISEYADKDAIAINHAGSMRMQSYKILGELQAAKIAQLKHGSSSELYLQAETAFNISMSTFEDKLNSRVLSQPFLNSPAPQISDQLQSIKSDWSTEIKPTILAVLNENLEKEDSSTTLYQAKIFTNQYVEDIEKLVLQYQRHAEQRIVEIRIIQGVSLILNIIFIVIIMHQLNFRIERPLNELIQSAKRIMAGDFTAQTSIDQRDELGFLSKTMNKMANSIADSHIRLEKRVRQKTHELETSNASLSLLYDISSQLSQPTPSLDLEPLVKRLSKIVDIQDIDLCLLTDEGSAPYEHIVTDMNTDKSDCAERDCNECIAVDKPSFSQVQACDPGMNIRYPLVKDGKNFGVLVCKLNEGSMLGAWQHQLLKSFCAQVATGLQLRQDAEQDRRFALVQERTVIARELHDSLAQALSYLQFQVTRLQKMQKKNATQEQIDDVVVELKTGLSSAYRQLRELLTTFRLTIDGEGLFDAFTSTIRQLNERANGKIDFRLSYNIGDIPLTPNEEIHLMQIAREATQNALHHSKGEHAQINLYFDEHDYLVLEVIDDGIGLGDNPEKLNHYGLAIMKERASQLNGELTASRNTPKGTKVALRFLPDYRKPQLRAS